MNRQAPVALLTILLIVSASLVAMPTPPQERFSFFQASTPESVQRLLTLAELRDDDVVVDLGSGDGLIPLTAARMNPRLRGWGVDIDRSWSSVPMNARRPRASRIASASSTAMPSTSICATRRW